MKAEPVRGYALLSSRKAGLRAGRSKILLAGRAASRIPVVHHIFHGKKMLPFLYFSLTELAKFHKLKTGLDESELEL